MSDEGNGLVTQKSNGKSFSGSFAEVNNVDPTSGLNDSLIEYIQQQGFVETANKLGEEIARKRNAIVEKNSTLCHSTKRFRPEKDEEDLLVLESQYQKLRSWVVLSLDEIRDEIFPVLWVVFVQFYVNLMERGAVANAYNFSKRFSADFAFGRGEELRLLNDITGPSVLDSNPLVIDLRSKKCCLFMRRYARDLLVGFLLDKDLRLVLNTINSSVEIAVDRPESSSRISNRLVYSSSGLSEERYSLYEADDDGCETTFAILSPAALKSENKPSVKWHVPTLFWSLFGGAIGAIARAAAYPPIPTEYADSVRPKGEEAGDEKSPKANQMSFKMSAGDKDVEIVQKITKLDRHNLDKAEKAAAKKERAKGNKAKTKKAIPNINHRASEDSLLDARKSTLCADIEEEILRLHVFDLEINEMTDSRVGDNARARATEICRAVGIEYPQSAEHDFDPLDVSVASTWPSIALQTFYHAHGGLASVDMASDLKTFAAGFDDSVVRVWMYSNDVHESDSKKAKSDENGFNDKAVCEDLFGHSGPVYAVDISPNRNTLLTASEDGAIRLWMRFPPLAVPAASDSEKFGDGSTSCGNLDNDDIGANECQRRRQSQGSWRNLFAYRVQPLAPIWDVKFCPAGYYFASGGMDGILRLWCIERYEPIRSYVGHLADIDCIEWHPNCHYIATGSSDKTIRVWSVLSSKDDTSDLCVRSFHGHRAPVICLKFCPSGRYLVSAAYDYRVIVWDFASGSRVTVLHSSPAPIYSLAISPDMHFIATGSGDGTVRVWNTDRIWGKGSLAHFLALKGHDSHVQSKRSIKSENQKAQYISLIESQEQKEEREAIEKDAANILEKRSKSIHVPKRVLQSPIFRDFPTKFTKIHRVKFHNERMVMASGSFTLSSQ